MSVCSPKYLPWSVHFAGPLLPKNSYCTKATPAVRRAIPLGHPKVAVSCYHIESKLVPEGETVTRHTTLPPKGHDPEWIANEMEKMDTEIGHAEWKHGKISGAVYRMLIVPLL